MRESTVTVEPAPSVAMNLKPTFLSASFFRSEGSDLNFLGFVTRRPKGSSMTLSKSSSPGGFGAFGSACGALPPAAGGAAGCGRIAVLLGKSNPLGASRVSMSTRRPSGSWTGCVVPAEIGLDDLQGGGPRLVLGVEFPRHFLHGEQEARTLARRGLAARESLEVPRGRLDDALLLEDSGDLLPGPGAGDADRVVVGLA